MTIDVRPSRAHDPHAAQLIHAYMADVVSRWHGRPAAAHEVASALAEEPASGLEPPHGHLAVAFVDDVPSGIGGLRLLDASTAELTKVFTLPAARGRGVAAAVLDHLEHVALREGRQTVRLDTRSDLAGACRLYERRGYARVRPFSDSPYSDRWYELRLPG